MLENSGLLPLWKELMHEGGYKAKEMKDSGYTAKEMKEAGYPAKEMKDIGYTTISSSADCETAASDLGLVETHLFLLRRDTDAHDGLDTCL